MKKKVIQWVSLLLVAVLVQVGFAGCAANDPAVSYPERPAMWEVTDPDSGNSIYLFGSIHAAQEDLYPLEQEIMDAFENSDYLAVEVDILALTEDLAKAMEMSSYMVYMDGSSITDEIGEDLYERLLALLEAEEMDMGIPLEMSEMFRPYTFISLLSELSVQKAGLSAEAGVDMHFLSLARERDMEVLEVESMESQLQMFNDFSPEVQAYLLEEGMLIEEAGEGVRQLYETWKKGDMDGLAQIDESEEELDEEEQALLEEYNKALLTDRNIGMTDVAEDYIQEGKKVFYVVGALHMVGEDGLVRQLTDRGYEVKRI